MQAGWMHPPSPVLDPPPPGPEVVPVSLPEVVPEVVPVLVPVLWVPLAVEEELEVLLVEVAELLEFSVEL